MRLSTTQERALTKLNKRYKPESAYTLQEALSTLNALCRHGLATHKAEQGSLFFPRVQIQYRITDKGREYIDDQGSQ